MRSLRIFLLFFIVLVACAIWSPWNSWNFNVLQLVGIEPPPEIGGLVVTALAGEVQVFVDNNLMGTAKVDAPLIVPDITPGERLVHLERVSDVDNAYWEYSKLIKFASGVDVVLTYELGPSQEFSAGHLIYASKDPNSDSQTYMNIVAFPEGAEVFVDGISIGTSPVPLYPVKLDKQISMKVVASGYEVQEFTVLPAEQSDRDKLKGYDLNIDVQLFLQPISVF